MSKGMKNSLVLMGCKHCGKSTQGKLLAQKLGESPETIVQYYNIALLHDIGKIGIPEAILTKSGKLSDEEFKIMKSHAQKGYEILKNVKIHENISSGAHYHHERFDGKGYPDGLGIFDSLGRTHNLRCRCF